MAESAALPVSALLEHRAFVRSLARQLLADEHAAEDVAQDTWLGLLSSPPRAVRSARTWLAEVTRNRAHNARRETSRRARRETTSARPEATEQVDVAERVELESRVVRAVLQLRDPYRSVVLGRYYEGRTTKELAARAGITESSVRSQETRALELLRAELDRTFDGGRDAWCLALMPLAGARVAAPALVSSPPAILLGTLLLVGVGLFALRIALGGAPENADTALAPIVTAVSEPEPEVDAAQIEPAGPDPRQAATPVAMSVEPARLDALDTPSLLLLARQIQRELRKKLLTPEPELAMRFADSREIRLARILERRRYGDSARADVIGLRGGGAYFSFLTGSNSYDLQPTLQLQNDRFQAGNFSGNGAGGVIDLWEQDLESFPADLEAPAPPARLDAEQTRQWELLWTSVQEPEGRMRESYRNDLWNGGVRDAPALPGHTYLLRSINAGELDMVAAFTCLSKDAHGCTIAWRLLKTWPIQGTPASRYSPPAELAVPPAPAWVVAKSIDELLALQETVRAVGTPRLLDAIRDLPLEVLALSKQPGGGLAKLLHLGRYDPLVNARGGGAYVAFSTGAREFDYDAQLSLSAGNFRSGFWGGDKGFTVDIGDVELRDLALDGHYEPTGLDETQRKAWRFLWDLRAPVSDPARGRAVRSEDYERMQSMGHFHSAKAAVGHTYLVRFIQSDVNKIDALYAFRDVAGDEDGHVIVWRTLKHFPLERAAPK